MTGHEYEDRIVEWAKRQSDVEALVLAGSRALASGKPDRWSDWDFHLVSSQPGRYYGTQWLKEIAPVWCAHSERTPRGVIKVSAVFEDGLEADFVPLAAWQMKLVYWSMRRPGLKKLMPARLRRGIVETRAFLLGSGYRVLVGGESWEQRLEATQVDWPARAMNADEYSKHIAAFWQKSVWICKKIARPEPRSAMHWMHMLIVEHVYALLAEEARVAGRVPRPEARKAELWLDSNRLTQTAIETSPDQSVLARTMLTEIALFEEVSVSVAQSRGFVLPDYSAVADWLRVELAKLST